MKFQGGRKNILSVCPIKSVFCSGYIGIQEPLMEIIQKFFASLSRNSNQKKKEKKIKTARKAITKLLALHAKAKNVVLLYLLNINEQG